MDAQELARSEGKPIVSAMTRSDRWDRVLARCGVDRGGHRVPPGLYALGEPDPGSPVFVTANYTLSFDALRSALAGRQGYILVLDTRGINVWCAAGEGTFGTDELVHRIQTTRLTEVVSHHKLILPQLGAPGIAAHQVKKRTGFTIEYGPVRAADLPQYLATGRATPDMRQVSFTLRDRLVLIPVEVVHGVLPMVVAAVLLFFVGGALAAWAAVTAVLTGVILLPLLLPWLPGRDLSVKGFVLGFVAALPFALNSLLNSAGAPWWRGALGALSFVLAMTPVTAFLALNFTGSTPFTSRSGVRREIFAYVPVMAGMFGAGLVLMVALALARTLGMG